MIYAQGQEIAYPDENFLEYLASLEEVDGEWLGPEEMQYLQASEPLVLAPDSARPLPEQLSDELEEKK